MSLKRFIKNCDPCSRAKPARHAPFGPLQPLPVPQERWWDISIDFITDLPPSQGFDAICVVKDRLSKHAHFIPTTKTISAPKLADLFLTNIFRLHGMPRSIVSDRGPQFVSKFWKRFQSLLGCQVHLSSAFHPETDGSTEVLNQVIEQYLRIHCTYLQDDWAFPHLALAEFTYNNSENSSTKMTPFMANHGHHPLFDPSIIRESIVPAAEDRVKDLQRILEDLKANLAEAQKAYTAAANRHRLPVPDIQPGDFVFLDRRFIQTQRPSSKLDNKKLGPFQVLRRVTPVLFELKLPGNMRIFPKFHASLIHPKTKDIIPEMNTNPRPPPVETEAGTEFVVDTIIDSRINKQRKRVEYLVRWQGYTSSDDTWEPLEHLTRVEPLIEDFHKRNPEKPCASGLRAKRKRQC